MLIQFDLLPHKLVEAITGVMKRKVPYVLSFIKGRSVIRSRICLRFQAIVLYPIYKSIGACCRRVDGEVEAFEIETRPGQERLNRSCYLSID